MASPTRTELSKALLSVINKTNDQQKLAKAIAHYLSEKRQTRELDAVMRDVARLRAEKGIIEATVISAFPLNETLKRDIRSLIAKEQKTEKIIINEVIDPSVLGGIRIETGEQQLDVTVQAKLHRLKRAIA